MHTRIASSNFPGVCHICGVQRAFATPAKKVDCHHDACSTNLDFRLSWIVHHVVRESLAYIQCAFSNISTKHWLSLNVRHLVDVQLCSLAPHGRHSRLKRGDKE